jgi:hypothetical protein
VVSIDILPDDVLLEIFDTYLYEEYEAAINGESKDSGPWGRNAWQTLVHVCRRWRRIVFGSPSGLELKLVCTDKTPTRAMLDVWPALPLCIRTKGKYSKNRDNIIAALERSDRVLDIVLVDVRPRDFLALVPAMKKRFPELSYLDIAAGEPGEVFCSRIPSWFPLLELLGGSAPSLKCLRLRGIPFPRLHNLLLSCKYLVELYLEDVPHTQLIQSPKFMLIALSALTRLEKFRLGFESFRCYSKQHERQSRPPITHPVLPALTSFIYDGLSECLEDIVAHIDAPQLRCFRTNFVNQDDEDEDEDEDEYEDGIPLRPQLVRFISRTPMLKALEKASVTFKDDIVTVNLSQCSSLEDQDRFYEAEYRQREEDWQDDTYLKLLRPFTAVKNLYLSEELAPCIVPALQELVGGRTPGVLPILQNVFLEGLQLSGPVQEAIGKFIAARQVTDHPIVVARWERNPAADDD